jgi:tRNA(His) 5'-end guanylyltransferase
MKHQYELRQKPRLPRRNYAIIRIDGRAFRTFTEGLDKPYDSTVADAMVAMMFHLFKHIDGVRFAYTQSDEISLILTDFETHDTEAWFDWDVQKVVSVSASLATVGFNTNFASRGGRFATFDSRVFTMGERTEVVNYLRWRQLDAVRNSISSLAQVHFSHDQLHKKNSSQMQEMLFQERGINWGTMPDAQKRGVSMYREKRDDDRQMVVASSPDFMKDFAYFDDKIPFRSE